MNEFKSQYESIWNDFTCKINSLSAALIDKASHDDDENFHAILSQLQVIPYEIAPKMFDSLLKESAQTNVGSVTGIFFEIIAASLVTGYFKKSLPDATIKLNSCSNENSLSRLCRDPDIFIVHQGKYVIFEVKVSPKKSNLERAIFLQDQYSNLPQKNASYFLIGGNVTANSGLLNLTKGWACFTSGSEINTPLLESFKLDTLLKKAHLFLE